MQTDFPWEHIVTQTSLCLLRLSPEGKILWYNKECEKAIFAEKNALHTFLQDHILDTNRAVLNESLHFKENDHSKHYLQLRFPTNSSEGIVTLQFNIVQLEDEIYAIGCDITQHDKEQQALTEISSLGRIAAWYYNPKTKEFFWSKEYYKMLDINPNDVADDVEEFYRYPQDARKIAIAKLQKLLETKEPFDYIQDIRKENGKWCHFRVTATPVVNNDEVIFVNGIIADVTERQQYIEKLQLSEETKKLALKGIRSGLFDHDIVSDTVYYSPAFRRMLGLSMKEEFLPEPQFRAMIHPDDVEEAYQRHLDNLLNRDPYYFNYYRLQHLNGNYYHYEVYGYCQKDKSGTTTRLIGNLIDVDGRKKNEAIIQKNQRYMRAMINNSFAYTFLLDKNGRILMTDKASIEIIEKDFGVNPNTMEVRFMDVLPLNFKNTYAFSFNEALKGFSTRKEVERITFEGKSQWLEIKYTPVYNDHKEVISVLLSALDITELKVAEMAVRQAHIKEQELHNLKNNILANFSHEIRTPLNGIMAISELLLSENDADERAKLKTYLNESKDRLLETINNLSNFSEVEAIKANLKIDIYDLNYTVESSFRDFDHLAERKQLEYQLQLDETTPKVKIDESLFRTSLNNIIHNAIKYTHNGRIIVTIHSNQTNKEVMVCVEDTGIGIAEENLQNIFDPFIQESLGMNRKYEGTGIGLSLSKKYIEILNGSIAVESSIHKGTKFTIKLPLHT